MVSIVVDNQRIEAPEGANLLAVCLDNGIFIPNLCYVPGMEHPPVSCRLCFVEIDGCERPVPSCATPVRADMVVRTDTPAVRQLQTAALRLLLSVHEVQCKKCPANGHCVLQNTAKRLEVALNPKPFERFLKEHRIGFGHPSLSYHPNRCVLCGRCVYVCRTQQRRSQLTFVGRGFETVIGFFGDSIGADEKCDTCRACVAACPVAALRFKE